MPQLQHGSRRIPSPTVALAAQQAWATMQQQQQQQLQRRLSVGGHGEERSSRGGGQLAGLPAPAFDSNAGPGQGLEGAVAPFG